uniref:SUEL-type lectin domain-containing protein n=1 Tax=Sinocyclocheilus anshuiensis TaxID=1608454 RepID=A0A671N3Y8_9TELE
TVACEGGFVHLRCALGLIKVIKANYGRTNRTTCAHWISDVHTSNMHCFQGSSLRIMSTRCNARKRCYVPAMNTVFSDPCAWTYKYLDVHYTVKIHNDSYGELFHVSDWGYIKVITANYGRTDHTTCSTGRSLHQLSNVDCFQETSVHVICDGRKSCSVPAVNSVFSDPCVGTHKYLDYPVCVTPQR